MKIKAVDLLVEAITKYQPISARRLEILLGYSNASIRSLISDAKLKGHKICIVDWEEPDSRSRSQWKRLYGIGEKDVPYQNKHKDKKVAVVEETGKYQLQGWDMVMQKIVRGRDA